MPGFLEVDTVRALFPHPHSLPQALGLSYKRQVVQRLPKWAWASQVSRVVLGTANTMAREHAQSGRQARDQSQRHTQRCL